MTFKAGNQEVKVRKTEYNYQKRFHTDISWGRALLKYSSPLLFPSEGTIFFYVIIRGHYMLSIRENQEKILKDKEYNYQKRFYTDISCGRDLLKCSSPLAVIQERNYIFYYTTRGLLYDV